MGLSQKQRIPRQASALSCVDVLVSAYWGGSLDINTSNARLASRDRFILSKGHAATALYATLLEKGIIDGEAFGKLETIKPRSPNNLLRDVPGGLSGRQDLLAMALVPESEWRWPRIQGNPFRVIVLVSDGECNEGSTWEAAMFAPAQKLTNLIAVVDSNKWQATGRTAEILALHPIREKFEAFGWNAIELDGHDFPSLLDAMKGFDREDGRPTAIIANTVKGKGISFMEDDNNWHYRTPTEDEVGKARKELGLALA